MGCSAGGPRRTPLQSKEPHAYPLCPLLPQVESGLPCSLSRSRGVSADVCVTASQVAAKLFFSRRICASTGAHRHTPPGDSGVEHRLKFLDTPKTTGSRLYTVTSTLGLNPRGVGLVTLCLGKVLLSYCIRPL